VLFPIVLIDQNSYAENRKHDQKADQNPVSKSTSYNHRLLFKNYSPSISKETI
jgi:hypothetical protein